MLCIPPGKRFFALALFVAALPALLVFPRGAAAAPARGSGSPGNYDARVMAPRSLDKKSALTGAQLIAQIQTMKRGLDQLRKTAPGASVRFSELTAAPEIVSGDKGALSAPAPGRPGIDVVRDFLRANHALYGLTAGEIDALHFIGESVSPQSGLRMVRIEQRVDGLTVFQSETRFLLDREGRVWRSLGLLVPSGATVAALPTQPRVSAPEALALAMKSVGITLDAARMRSEGAGTRLEVHDDQVGKVASALVYVSVAPGRLVPAWRQVTFTAGDSDWYTLVDATTGTLLWRKDIREHVSTQPARFSVYVQGDGVTPADSPAPQSPSNAVLGAGMQFPEIARTTVSMFTAQDLTASPNGWIPDGGTTTTGNNVDACVDDIVTPPAMERNVCDIGAIDNNGRPVGNPDGGGNNRDFLGAAPRDFSYSPAPLGGNPDAGDDPTGTGTSLPFTDPAALGVEADANQVRFRRGSITQIFYIANWYHDQLFNMGFDEAAGNFQTTNFSGMGTGNDPIRADVQDGAGVNLPSFSTPPDGASGRLTMHLFPFPDPNRDSALDAEIAIHELTHGLSNRLIGNAGGLTWSVGRALGEGWSDFYAFALLNNTNADNPDGKYAFGAYSHYKRNIVDNYIYGTRRFPYTTDNTINPLTWADTDDVTANVSGGIPPNQPNHSINGGLNATNAGEVWALSLWEVRSRVIADPAGANGDVPTGNQTMLQLVTDALKMTPSNPSFTDARDALLLADCATNACANERSIWAGFADRGLGYGAVAPLGHAGFGNVGHIGVGESFALPHLDFAIAAVNDSVGNGDGSIDPGEPIQLTVHLFNPWRNAALGVPGATATLTSSTPGVTIVDGTSVYGAIPAQTTTPGDPFLFTVSTSALCGQSLKFTITTVSALGTSAVGFTLRVGTPAGTGTPVTYTRTIPQGLAIPDGDLRGIVDTLTITDDLEIADLDFRVDDLQHTFTGDMTLLLKAPNGYGADLIWQRGAGVLGDGTGANFVDTVIDDESTNDLNQSVDTDAPYTGSWAPAFNSDVWNLFGSLSIFPDPIGQLSRLDGLSTQGDWKVLAADVFGSETGTLNAWSLIVTPTAFTCAVFAPAPSVSGTKTVSGTFSPGGAVTYTVTLTNNGTASQPDNAGAEFTDVLPAGVTLVSATATSGAAVATVGTNTVTWNGSLAPLGGSATITINATVNAGTQGQTISNQGTISFDADANGSNEATAATDDPGTPAANDPTSFSVAPGMVALTATKTVSGTPTPGSTLTYTVVLTNGGALAQADNPGNEFTDVLPASLTLVSATATSGTAVPTVGTNTVTWNGPIPAGGSVTITITATVNAGTTGQTISNQGSTSFDANGDGTNDTAGSTDNPATPAAGDPTSVVVAGASVTEIPTLSEMGFAALALLLAGAALILMRRRRAA
jgi:uncharacterized repeat protein (TIGR01451 family)